ncbi:hypothetical protein [Alteromonas flava]|uniref:hypothetical protein n=1 Tax=Alteromonas flava TaxID=2048003 RepID=UPI000F5E7CAD|nr:hypothetical protein [Alteromonas flava]
MDKSTFQRHGEFVTRRSGQLLLFSGRGPWNDQTMRIGSRDMAGYIQQFDHKKPWAQISALYGESLMPPSTFDSFVKHTVIRKQIGLEALSVVIFDSDVALTIEAQLRQAYEVAELEPRFFTDIESAIDSLDPARYQHDLGYVQGFFRQHQF